MSALRGPQLDPEVLYSLRDDDEELEFEDQDEFEDEEELEFEDEFEDEEWDDEEFEDYESDEDSEPSSRRPRREEWD